MDKVKIKGIKNGFRIVIAEYEKFDEVFEDILEKVNNTLEQIAYFFKELDKSVRCNTFFGINKVFKNLIIKYFCKKISNR